MKHLTKDINQLGRSIAARVLREQRDFEFTDDDDFLSSYFVTCKYKNIPAAIKILAKASVDKFGGVPCFQMDEAVTEKVTEFTKATNRKMIIVLVDTRAGEISWQWYEGLFNGYEDHDVKFPLREPSSSQGPIYWNSCWRMRHIGVMSQTERDRLIVLRTKNKADKNQKSIFDK